MYSSCPYKLYIHVHTGSPTDKFIHTYMKPTDKFIPTDMKPTDKFIYTYIHVYTCTRSPTDKFIHSFIFMTLYMHIQCHDYILLLKKQLYSAVVDCYEKRQYICTVHMLL